MQPNSPTPDDPQPPYGQQPQPGQYGGSADGSQPAAYAQPDQYAQPARYAAPSEHSPAPYGQPHGQPGQRAGGAMPAVVKWGLGIQWAGVAIGVVGIGLGLLGLAAIAGLSEPAETDAAALGLVGVALAVAAVLIVAQVIVLVFATKGRNWARIVLAVLAALGIVVSLASGQGLNIGSAISIVSVVLLFLPAANEWYAARSAQR
ncbi:MAG: hypothetical protein WC580_02555 [Agrococcus sp.]